MGRSIILLIALTLAACSASGANEMPDAADSRIRDFAEVLGPAEEARLAARLDEAERLYGPQVGIVTLTSLGGRSIKDFTTDYANRWGLGDKDRDDGLIILIAPNERSTRIGTGLGIEKTYPDAWAQEVIDKTMLPHFSHGEFGIGLEAAVEMIIERMKLYPTLPANDNIPTRASEAA